jgi:LysW-gamma-L-lysine carboxypeptidase
MAYQAQIMIELLEQCVRIPSLSGHERQVAEFLCQQMRQRGVDRAFIDDAGNAVGVIGDGPRQIVLLGHMDTVGGDVPVRYADSKLYGRGTVDAKGPLCAFVLAAERWAKMRFPPHPNPLPAGERGSDWQIVVIGAVEEEAATSKGARFAATQYAPEYCVIGEPSGVDGITLGYKGRLLAHARFEQASRHTAMPGPSASEQAVMLWNQAKAFADAYNTGKSKAFDQIMLSLRKIQSGDDGLREWCDLLIGARLPVEFGPEALEREIREWRLEIGNHQSSISNLQSLTFSGQEQAYRSSKDTPLARTFVDAIRAEKMRPAFKHKTGTADFNVVGPIWNCPIVAYGPGDSALDHTPDEHVSIDEFEKAVKVLTFALTALTRS